METTLNYLGSTVEDKITKFTGIVVAENHRAHDNYINLCIQGISLKDKKPSEPEWMSPDRINVIKKSSGLILGHNAIMNDMAIDSITKFKGVVAEITFWLYECVRVGLQSEKLKDGLPQKVQWFDEAQVLTKSKGEDKSLGGPMRMDSPNK